METKKWITNAAVAIAVACMFGCGIQPTTLASIREAVNTVSSPQPLPTTQSRSENEAAKPVFEPSNPDRVDPFSFPREVSADDSRDTTVHTVAQVDILGFAHVREPRVLLRSRGLTKSLKVGDSTDGVEVIAIDPPTVQLRMGSKVWKADMFDGAGPGKE